MTYAHWDTIADYEQEKQITEHDFEMQQQKIDELTELVSMLLKSSGLDTPLTVKEKKNMPKW
jgi:hypothetical protein